MATFTRLAALNFSGGYNTREEPRGLDATQCQDLLNLYPSATPRPREGCGLWRENADPDSIIDIPFELASGNAIISIVEDDNPIRVRWQSGASELIPLSFTPPKAHWTISWVRIENKLILSSDYEDWSAVIEWTGRNFIAYPAYIEPTSIRAEADPSATAGGLRAQSYYSYAFTLVNKSETGAGYFKPLVESPENPDFRTTVFTEDKTSVDLSVTISATLGATHLRVYRTQPKQTIEEAQGGTHLWVTDIPYSTSVTFNDKESGSEGDVAVPTSALSILPSCLAMKFHAGRLWVAPKSDRLIGRWIYSAPYTGTTPLFNPSSDFKDTSLFDAQAATGAAVVQDDLYLFSERSIHRIANGDPDNRIEVISTKVGCPFPKTITESDQWIWFLSGRGPYMLQGGVVAPLRAFAAGEVWPSSFQGGSILRMPRKAVYGFEYKQNWVVGDGERVLCFHVSDDGDSAGATRLEFADPKMRLRQPIVFSNSEVAFNSDTSRYGQCFVWFLREDEKTDCGYFIKLGAKARRLYVDPKDPSAKAEPYDIRLFANFQDNGEMKLSISGDRSRFNKLFRYEERPKSAILQTQDIDAKSREVFQQAIPSGLLSSFFDISWEKFLRPPFTFTCMGIEVRVIPRNRPMDSVSLSLGSDAVIDSDLLPFETTEGGST